MYRIVHQGLEAAVIGAWVAKRIGGFYEANHSQAIGLEKHGHIVAGAIFENYNGRSLVCHIACEGLITRTFLWAIGDFAFNQCNVHKVIAPVASDNMKAIRLVEHLGFREEARLKDVQPNGDMCLFTVQRERYPFLKYREQREYAFA